MAKEKPSYPFRNTEYIRSYLARGFGLVELLDGLRLRSLAMESGFGGEDACLMMRVASEDMATVGTVMEAEFWPGGTRALHAEILWGWEMPSGPWFVGRKTENFTRLW